MGVGLEWWGGEVSVNGFAGRGRVADGPGF